MTRNFEVDLKRRFMIAAAAGFAAPVFCFPRWMQAEAGENPILCWKLEEAGDSALESIAGEKDRIESRTGHAHWVGEGRNRALRLDGYSVRIKHSASPAIFRGNSITVMAWIALESYPVDEAAVIQLDGNSNASLRFSIDKLGFLQFGEHPGNADSICKSSDRVPKAKWTHLAASVGDSGITLYRDGVACGQLASYKLNFKPESEVSIAVGIAPDCPVIAGTFPTGVLNGLLRDVRVYTGEHPRGNGELSRGAIDRIMQESKPHGIADLEINGPWCIDDPQRPICHAMPPRAWTNEPHGLIRWRGQYHLFYQKNPNGPYWGHIHWGHMTSPDLRGWMEMPVALAPELGCDSEGCWSGSVIDHNGRLAIIYTAGDGHRSSICLAHSDDGIHFTKHPANPIISEPPQGHGFPEFRDPFVWREGDIYYLIIGSTVKDVGGTALLYRSKDLVAWEYRKQLFSGDRSTSGTFWEMPIFVKAGEFHALIVCEVPGRASYWVGSWKDETFTPIDPEPRRLELFNHLLSPTPMFGEDGQVTVMGIIPDERRPKETWAAGWAHLYSLPRALSSDSSGLLSQRPLEAIDRWTETPKSIPDIDLPADSPYELKNVAEKSFRLRATFRKGDSKSVSIFVRRSPNGQEQTEIHYAWESGLLTLDRSQSSLDPMVRRDRKETPYATRDKDSVHLDVLVDRSALEVFVDGRAAFAARIYPTLDRSDGIALSSAGTGARVEKIHIARIRGKV